jgi:VIT1/CCC1 family predicted Fe2+/Mn2+ transporter
LLLKRCFDCHGTLDRVTKSFDDTFLEGFDENGKKAVAQQLIDHVGDAQLGESKVLTRNEVGGWLSIIGIYLTVGFLMALPFLILPDKLIAWIFSNSLGVAWVAWYGVQLGKAVGKYRWLMGLILAAVGISFLIVSYIVWT